MNLPVRKVLSDLYTCHIQRHSCMVAAEFPSVRSQWEEQRLEMWAVQGTLFYMLRETLKRVIFCFMVLLMHALHDHILFI